MWTLLQRAGASDAVRIGTSRQSPERGRTRAPGGPARRASRRGHGPGGGPGVRDHGIPPCRPESAGRSLPSSARRSSRRPGMEERTGAARRRAPGNPQRRGPDGAGAPRSLRQETSCLWDFVPRCCRKLPRSIVGQWVTRRLIHFPLVARPSSRRTCARHRTVNPGEIQLIDLKQFSRRGQRLTIIENALESWEVLAVRKDVFTDFSTASVESGGVVQTAKGLVHESREPHEIAA